PPPPSTLSPYTTLFRSPLHPGDLEQRPGIPVELDPLQEPRRKRRQQVPDPLEFGGRVDHKTVHLAGEEIPDHPADQPEVLVEEGDRKSTRLNSSHVAIS